MGTVRIKFKGGHAFDFYDNGVIRFSRGEEKEVPEDRAKELVSAFGDAFEIVAETKKAPDKPPTDRMLRKPTRKRGKEK